MVVEERFQARNVLDNFCCAGEVFDEQHSVRVVGYPDEVGEHGANYCGECDIRVWPIPSDVDGVHEECQEAEVGEKRQGEPSDELRFHPGTQLLVAVRDHVEDVVGEEPKPKGCRHAMDVLADDDTRQGMGG